jgi:hypothetical protein
MVPAATRALGGIACRAWGSTAKARRADRRGLRHDEVMTPLAAELSSMGATVEDLTGRLRSIASQFEQARRDDLAAEVHEVERALEAARRRLDRLVAAET